MLSQPGLYGARARFVAMVLSLVQNRFGLAL
jgi:hypothetical protein